jgi:hypothetical protein
MHRVDWPLRNSIRSTPQFLVGRDRAGYWIATDMDGSTGGLFKDRASAIRYAKQTSLVPGAVELVDEPLELRLGVPPLRAT